jgi:beta-lactamase regulating signal transducer with metallopeptidase domain
MKEALLYELIFKILNMSITATFMTLAVILLRLLLRKAPKWISYALWSVVLFRLICPFPSPRRFPVGRHRRAPAESGIVSYIPENIVHTEYPRVDLIIRA